MNKYLKDYLHRGLMFGGFGPIIAGIVYLIISFYVEGLSVSGVDFFTAIISSYVLAFVCAGSSVFNQIEHWSIAKSLAFHLSSYYLAHIFCYLINSWIPFDLKVILIFTGIFILSYFAIWLTVYICVKITGKRMSAKIRK